MRTRGTKRIATYARALWAKYLRDGTMDAAASLTFYTFLAAFPFLLFVTTVATQQLTPELTVALVEELHRFLPEPAIALVTARLQGLREDAGPGLMALSLAGALASSTTAVVALMVALNRAYEVPERRSIWRVYRIALATTLLTSVLVLASSALTVAWPLVAAAIGGDAGEILDSLRFPLASVLMMIVLALSYRWLPDVRARRQRVVPGAIVGVLLWLLASWGFTAYVRVAGNYEVVYGALGGVAILLLWMWLTGQAIIIGAELNQLLSREDERRA